VKAHCVPRGITSQFLNEHTLSEEQECRVWWWLSLGLYVIRCYDQDFWRPHSLRDRCGCAKKIGSYLDSASEVAQKEN